MFSGQKLRAAISVFPLPASRFWESAEQINDRLLSLPNDISHLQRILAQPESSSDAGRFLLMVLNFKVNNNNNSVDKSQEDSFPRQG